MSNSCYAPTFPPSADRSICWVRSLGYILAIFFLLLFSWVPTIRCLILQLNYRVRHCNQGNTNPSIDLSFSLDEWLMAHRSIAQAIIWHDDPEGRPLAYLEWTAGQKAHLAGVFRQAYEGDTDRLLPETPPLIEPLPRFYGFDRETAWNIFLAHVAQSLATDISELVEWRLSALSQDQLKELLNSDSLFKYSFISQPQVVDNNRTCWTQSLDNGAATPGDPLQTFAFLRDQGLLRSDIVGTIERVLEWCRDNLEHYAEVQFDYWQYRGQAPVERIIAGTAVHAPGRDYDGRFRHWTAGCAGTCGFLKMVLRTANIPVKVEYRCGGGGLGHALPCFMLPESEGGYQYLSHGDNPYDAWIKECRPPIRHMRELLIDKRRFLEWFGSSFNGCPEGPGGNIDRRVIELAIEYLPDPLLLRRCLDLNDPRTARDSNFPHSEGCNVFLGLNPRRDPRVIGGREGGPTWFRPDDLDRRDLWTRLDDKIRLHGNCRTFDHNNQNWSGP